MYKCTDVLEKSAKNYRSLFWCFFSQAVFDVLPSTVFRLFFLSTVSYMPLGVHSAQFLSVGTAENLISAPLQDYQSACFLLFCSMLFSTIKWYFTLSFHHSSWYMYSYMYLILTIALFSLICLKDGGPKTPPFFSTFPSMNSQKRKLELRIFVS